MSLPQTLTIGPLTFDTPILFAPLAGYSDFAFRMSLRALGGVGFAYTEMLSPASLLIGKAQRLKSLTATSAEDLPLGHQIYGAHYDTLCAGAVLLEQRGAQLIDINMGCPQRKISVQGAGAGLLRDPKEAIRIAAGVVRSVRIPVTVKLRLGWDTETLVAHDMVPELEAAGVAAITIHGRTRCQGFSGEADLQGIRTVVQAAKRIPVIGNGDIASPAAARRMFEVTGCAGIMLGRGPLKNPWLIRDIWNELRGLPAEPPPGRDEWIDFAGAHFERMIELYGPLGATRLYRKWIPQYLRRMLAGRRHLVEMMQLEDAVDMRHAIESLRKIRSIESPDRTPEPDETALALADAEE
jgi:nifR3 family TIM-barrel protein